MFKMRSLYSGRDKLNPNGLCMVRILEGMFYSNCWAFVFFSSERGNIDLTFSMVTTCVDSITFTVVIPQI